MKYQKKGLVFIVGSAVVMAISALSGNGAQPAISVLPGTNSWQSGGSAIVGTVADPDIVDLGDGQFRMYYSLEPEADGFNGQVYSALSEDGVNWQQEAGTRITGATFPSVIELPDGRYRMYYQNQGVIKSAISFDGLSWSEESGIRINTNNSSGLVLEEVASPTVYRNGTEYVIVYRGTINERYSTNVPNSDTTVLLGAVSYDGLYFINNALAIDSRNEEFQGLLDGPEFVQWDDGTPLLYFWSYRGIYHKFYEYQNFSDETYFDYTTDSSTSFPENPPGDPTYLKTDGRYFLYYGQHTKGIYFATDKPWKVCNDFDGDRRTDPAVYYASSGKWSIFETSTFNIRTEYLGGGAYLPAPGDYDGDGITDLAVFDSATAHWRGIFSSSGGEGSGYFGSPGTWPVSGDYDGDRITDAAVYDPLTGIWTALLSTTDDTASGQWGYLGDFRDWDNPQTYTVLPMPFDYNQDGVDDLAYYYRGTGMPNSTWDIFHIGVGSTHYVWGSSGSLPVPGNYQPKWADAPQGVCICKLKNKVGNQMNPSEWGIPFRSAFYMGTYKETLPVPAGDYDGNGYDDNAVYNYVTGLWSVIFNDGAIEVAGRPEASITLGGPGAVPANIYSTIYALARYLPDPGW